LPRWRGAAPIQPSIEFGDDKIGVTIMQVVEALDAGAMYKKGEVEITSSTTGGRLHDKLAEIGAGLISDVLSDLEMQGCTNVQGEVVEIKQYWYDDNFKQPYYKG
jgi:methionyl-tRNA formyltransferase